MSTKSRLVAFVCLGLALFFLVAAVALRTSYASRSFGISGYVAIPTQGGRVMAADPAELSEARCFLGIAEHYVTVRPIADVFGFGPAFVEYRVQRTWIRITSPLECTSPEASPSAETLRAIESHFVDRASTYELPAPASLWTNGSNRFINPQGALSLGLFLLTLACAAVAIALCCRSYIVALWAKRQELRGQANSLHCIRCGHPLVGSDRVFCPECGWFPSPAELFYMRERAR